jgi:mono/diheme cytochrome c family protein
MRILRWLAVLLLLPSVSWADQVQRGKYVFNVAGCANCHTQSKGKGAELAGGDALKTPFGDFYGPNITPDLETGIGSWREADFIAAMRLGRRPDGSSYFPVFPYTSYRGMTDSDLADVWAYLKTVPAVNKPSTPHDIKWPFGWRGSMRFWNWLYLTAPSSDDFGPAGAEPIWQRGQYIADHLAHCGECHTPRTFLGGPDTDQYWAGGIVEGEKVPNITADRDHGIGSWSPDDLDGLLTIGMLPDGDFVGGSMGHVVDGTSILTDDDRAALIAYIQSVPARRGVVGSAD